MKHKIFSKLFILFLFVATIHLTADAQNISLQKTLPRDTGVLKGKLSNGLTYYIRPNAKPKNKVQLRLVVDAAAMQEDENQRGLAHFMEHMNFNGLKHFPKNELVDYLQNIGVRFGADLNANTGFDRTFYILPIPTDNPENLKKGFQILADWADGAILSTDEINDERKVISEELRMRDKNAGTRMRKKYFPKLLNGSRYAYRLPGGKDSIVLHASPDLIRQFYHDWYRPDLMAVIVVGDISKKKGKAMVKKYFGKIKNPKNERERKYYEVKPYIQPDGMIVTDPETTNYNFTLLFPAQKRKIEKTVGDYRHSLVRQLFTSALNHKLHKLTQSAQPPYVGTGASVTGIFGSLTLKNQGFTLNISPVDNFKTSIDSAVAVLLRVRDYGFSKKEIDNIKKRMLTSYKKHYNERNKTLSNAYVGEYTRNFMRQEPIPGIVKEYHYVQELLPTIKTKEVSSLANKILSHSTNFFALITGPENGDIPLPNKKELIHTVEQAFQQKVQEKEDTETATSLLKEEPIAGTIISHSKDEQLGTTTYMLSNGVKVTVKPTDFKDDQILFQGIKYGGSDQYGVKDVSNVRFLTGIIGTMGYGQFTPTELSDFLSGKSVSLGTGFGALSDNVNGSSSVEDIKTLLQLNYLKLTKPRKDTNLFKGMIRKLNSRLKYMKSNPQMAFGDTLMKVLYKNNPLVPNRIPTEEDLKNINLDRVIGIYNHEFGNAKGYHFFIVGNIEKIDLKPLMEKYLASLPVFCGTPSYKDNGVRMEKGDKTFKFYKGTDQKSLIFYRIHGKYDDFSEDLALKTSLLGKIMTMQINDTIREKMQVIYSGGANASLSKRPYMHYSVSMQLPCGPENVDTILKELNREIKGYQTNGGPAGSLHKARKATLEQHKENLKKNGYWIGKLKDILFWGKSKTFFLNFDQEVKNISEEDIIQTAQKMLDGNRFIAISYPEKGSGEKQ